MQMLSEQVKECLQTPASLRHLGWKFLALGLAEKLDQKIEEVESHQFTRLKEMYSSLRADLKMAIIDFNLL